MGVLGHGQGRGGAEALGRERREGGTATVMIVHTGRDVGPAGNEDSRKTVAVVVSGERIWMIFERFLLAANGRK